MEEGNLENPRCEPSLASNNNNVEDGRNNCDSNVIPSNAFQKWYHIDVYMLPAKFGYFFQMAKDFSYQPFLVLFLIETGLTVKQASFIAGIRLIGMLLGSPFFGYIADKTCKHRYVIVSMCISSMLLMGSQPFISAQIGNEATNVCPANDVTNRSLTTMRLLKQNEATPLFVVMLLTNIGASFVDGGMMGMIDNGAIHRIKCAETKKDFGWNRLFGAVGFGAGSLIAGFFVQNFPPVKVTCYSSIFLVYLFCMAGLLISAWFLYSVPVKNVEDDSITKLFIQTLKKFDNMIFLLTVFLMGIEQGTFVNFTTLTLNSMGASKVVQGLSISLAGYSCIITILLSTKVIQWFRGTWNTMIICSLSYVIRFALFGFLANPIYAIPISLFQSFGLGLFITAAVHHVRNTSPEHLHTTMYGIMNALHYGAGFLTASLVGGVVYDSYGSRILFSSVSILMAFWSITLIGYKLLLYFRPNLGDLTS